MGENSLYQLKQLRGAAKKREKERKKQESIRFEERMNRNAPRDDCCGNGHTFYCCEDCFGNPVYCYYWSYPDSDTWSSGYQCCWCHFHPCYHNFILLPLIWGLIIGFFVGLGYLMATNQGDNSS